MNQWLSVKYLPLFNLSHGKLWEWISAFSRLYHDDQPDNNLGIAAKFWSKKNPKLCSDLFLLVPSGLQKPMYGEMALAGLKIPDPYNISWFQ